MISVDIYYVLNIQEQLESLEHLQWPTESATDVYCLVKDHYLPRTSGTQLRTTKLLQVHIKDQQKHLKNQDGLFIILLGGSCNSLMASSRASF